MALSNNFEKEMNRRETPECYGTYKKTSELDKKKCGMCWFAHKCKAGTVLKDFGGKEEKEIPAKETGKTSEKETKTEPEKDSKKKGIFNK